MVTSEDVCGYIRNGKTLKIYFSYVLVYVHCLSPQFAFCF